MLNDFSTRHRAIPHASLPETPDTRTREGMAPRNDVRSLDDLMLLEVT